MSQMRRDAIVGRWVVIDSDRLQGPKDFPKEDNTPTRQAICPFCDGREDRTPPESDAVRPLGSKPNSPGWLVRTIPNKFPALISNGHLEKDAVGIFDAMTGIGAHEVLIETPNHERTLSDLTDEEFRLVIDQYQSRYIALAKDKRFKYILIFKNFGASAGATVEHTHSQIIALPMVPKTVLEEIKGAEHYRQSHGRCVFCDVVNQEYQDKERIVIESKSFLAFCPFAPRYAFETWIIPKAHQADFGSMDKALRKDLAHILKELLVRMRKVLGNPSYNYYVHTAPIDYATPACYHWHIEVIPKLTRSVGFEWATGLHIVPTFPKDAAESLRTPSAT